jgi:NhaA family Na+:H+ antiporter
MSERPSVKLLKEELPPAPVDRLLAPLHRFTRLEASGGILLLACTAAALGWANSPWGREYHDLFHGMQVTFSLGDWVALSKPVEWWINDAVMAVFFFLVGLEIKREILVGELSSVRKAALPMMAALGGMVVPATIFAVLNLHHEGSRGWGVPMATDIAFALGVLALLGKRVPLGLRVFLTTLAIADDLGALVVIAVFYTEDLAGEYLVAAFSAAAIMGLMNWLGVRSAIAYLVVGLVLWYMVLLSGVHATIAGVLGAMTIPVRTRVDTKRFLDFTRQSVDEFMRAGASGSGIVTDARQQALVQAMEDACNQAQTPLQQLEHALTPWVAFLIVPVFALANAGVDIHEGLGGEEGVLVSVGVGLGLMLGKPLGIFAATWLAVRLRMGELPSGVRWGHIHGAGWLAGIGFTMALFIAHLAYRTHPEFLTAAKVGILSGSALAAVVGLFVLLRASRVPAAA